MRNWPALPGLRNLCFQEKQRFVHEELGWNFRMTNLQAAVGLAQLERLDEFVARKRRMGERYTELLAGIGDVQLPLAAHGLCREHLLGLRAGSRMTSVPFDAEEAMRRLGAAGIGTRPFFWPMHEQPVFHKMGLFAGEHYPVAERMARRGFYIPSGLALTEQQIERVGASVREVLK